MIILHNFLCKLFIVKLIDTLPKYFINQKFLNIIINIKSIFLTFRNNIFKTLVTLFQDMI